MAASDRRKKLFLRGTALGIVIAVVGLGLSGVLSLRDRANARGAAADSAAAALSRPEVVDSVATPAAPPQNEMPAAATALPSAAAAPPPPASPTVTAQREGVLEPTVRVGETPLGNGTTATRNDSGVVVSFDTPELRTRLPEKFERYLRVTLPQVYGARVDTLLANIPLGKLTAQGDLLYELPVRGIRIPVRPGWHLEVFPEIRAGRDGPLVVRYRAAVNKD